MSGHFQRAWMLVAQGRHDLAEQELRHGLAQDPSDALAHSMLGLCLVKREQYQDAMQEAQEGVRLAPDLGFAHYALAGVLCERGRFKEADQSISMALMLDPEDADYAYVQSMIRFNQRRWADALEAAERGLRVDPEHVGCNNTRAMALIKLGRKQEAGATIRSALSRDPENTLTHANQGWALLEQGDPAAALDHFRESLRLDPENEWARRGVVEALKAKHLVYRLMLRFFLWMAKLSHRVQWLVILGIFFGQRLLASLSKSYPTLAPVFMAVLVLVFGFVLLSWIADPLFNLLLRLNRTGRMALSREQVVASTWLGLCLLGVVASLVFAFGLFVTGRQEVEVKLAAWAALAFGFLCLPCSATFRIPGIWPRRIMGTISILLALAGPGVLLFWSCLLLIHGPTAKLPGAIFDVTEAIHDKFYPGVALSTWLSVALNQIPRRR